MLRHHTSQAHARDKMSRHEALRVTLNVDPLKELVVLSNGLIDDSVVQILKRGEIEAQFSYYEIKDFLTCPMKLMNIVNFMAEETPPSLIHHYVYTLRHEIFFSFLRDKPFLAITSTGPIREYKGVPLFETCHIGQTAFHSIRRHIKPILRALADSMPKLDRDFALFTLSRQYKACKRALRHQVSPTTCACKGVSICNTMTQTTHAPATDTEDKKHILT